MSASLHIFELNHIALYVRDLTASEQFYEQLGMRRLPRPQFPFPGAWFAADEQQLHLITDTMHLNDERHSLHVAFRVEDARAAYDALVGSISSLSVPSLSAPSVRPDGAVQVFLQDPDGYRIELVSLPPRNPCKAREADDAE